MSIHIDFRTLPANVPVLCIPRVYPNISESRIRKIFDELNMGTLDRIDIITKQSEKGEQFNRVFVHFARWNNSENACTARERLLNGKEIKIIYDEPWFWKVSAYREAERKPQIVHQGPRKATIQFDSDDEGHSSRPRDRDSYRERRRDDSRERPRHHHDNSRPRHHHDNSRPRQYQDNSNKPKPQEFKKPEKVIRQRSPSNSPPRQHVKEIVAPTPFVPSVNYTDVKVMRRKIHLKKSLKIEDSEATNKDIEEGEIKENV
jgi:hypothetical protein